MGIFRPFSVTNERPEISALFPGKRADFSFFAWAEGGGRRADFTEGPWCSCQISSMELGAIDFLYAMFLSKSTVSVGWKSVKCQILVLRRDRAGRGEVEIKVDSWPDVPMPLAVCVLCVLIFCICVYIW